jgi:hypothetical protein
MKLEDTLGPRTKEIPMARWEPDELDGIATADELKVASRRSDGSLRTFITIWVVRLGDDLYVRSAYGPQNGWYRRALAAADGRIRAGGVERDVTFETPGPEIDAELNAAYHAKYDRFGARLVRTVVSDEAARTTLRLVPR